MLPRDCEYQRLMADKVDPALNTLVAEREYCASDLALGRLREADVRWVHPGTTSRPNPVVHGDQVIVATSDPGRLVAVDRRAGDERWRIELGGYGTAVLAAPEAPLIYSGTPQEVVAVEPDTGRIVWTFCPYGRSDETIYSLPILADRRVYVGDRRGWFYCLDAMTGSTEWAVRPSRADNNSINATGVASGGVVFTATNSRWVIAFEGARGREVWRTRIDAPCSREVSLFHDQLLLCTRRSVYLLSQESGSVTFRWTRRSHYVERVVSAGDTLLAITRHHYGNPLPLWPVSELRAFRGAQEVGVISYPRRATMALRYEPLTGLVYESTSYGVGLFDPRTLRRRAVIRDFAPGEDGRPNVQATALPSYADGMLYVHSEGGYLFALRHPEIPVDDLTSSSGRR